MIKISIFITLVQLFRLCVILVMFFFDCVLIEIMKTWRDKRINCTDISQALAKKQIISAVISLGV